MAARSLCFLLCVGVVSAENICHAEVCDDVGLLALHTSIQRHRQEPDPHTLADGTTSAYKRPPAHSPLQMSSIPRNTDCPKPPCSEQIHLQLGGPGEMVISFASDVKSGTRPLVYWGLSKDSLDKTTEGTTNQHSLLMYWDGCLWGPHMGPPQLRSEEVARAMSKTWSVDPASGWRYPGYREVAADEVESNHGRMGDYSNPTEHYHSPDLHTVVLQKLPDDKTFFYRVQNDNRVFSFKTPKGSSFPFTVGMVGDAGMTKVSEASFSLLAERQQELILYPGDLSYADGYFPLWDAYGRLYESLGAQVPTMYAPGNHEAYMMEGYVSYNERFPMRYAAKASGSNNPQFWSRDVGPMHLISLNTYSASDSNSAQYRWLERDLRRVNRTRTPWVVAMMHAPMYSSNMGHIGQSMLFRQNFQDLFYTYGVNIVVAGHVHGYERTYRIYQNQTDSCGSHFITIGDGGNREGAGGKWLHGRDASESQPHWSGFRELSFGIGQLTFRDRDKADWTWNRHACYDTSMQDSINFDAENCQTTGDNSETALVASDTYVFRRNQSCKNQQRLR